jgi:predicted ATP-binding protein involved in virulence
MSEPVTTKPYRKLPVKITAIKIKGLFEIFDYDIAFPQGENALIITGPNGFGKTMVLNILFNLFSEQYGFFWNLAFREITVVFDNQNSVVIGKRNIGLFGGIVIFWIRSKNGETEKFSLTPTASSLGNDNFFNQPFSISGNSAVFSEIIRHIRAHLIREQRLFKKVPDQGQIAQIIPANQTLMIETIQSYAEDLKKLLSGYAEKSVAQTQQLDSSYPMRLRAETQPFNRKKYEARYGAVAVSRQKLAKYGLYRNEQEMPSYAEEDKKALTVYLKDLETKLGVFADILEKLELFTGILNERRFTFKTIQVSPDRGFFFRSSTGKDLALEQLSSGEQHEVVLLYELIFNVTENTLVLIDEPEISLHITWQKEFLADLLRIIKIQNIQVIIATHSPAIINGRWDLTYNLEKKAATE